MIRARWGLLVAIAAGCAPASSPCGVLVPVAVCPAAMAQDRFSDKNTCPRERVATREREDLPIHLFACHSPQLRSFLYAAHRTWDSDALPGKCAERPPDEVARDPERMALWRRLKTADWARFDGLWSSAVEVEGCGARRFYACWRGLSRRSPQYLCEESGLSDLGDEEPAAEP
jgi:hypothetical protein